MATRLSMSQLSGLVSAETPRAEETVPPDIKPAYGAGATVPKVTVNIIDEAVLSVLEKLDLPEDVKESFKMLMANDPAADFATKFYTALAREDSYTAATRLERKQVTLHAVVDEKEVADLAAFAPEYDIRYAQSDNHCHGPGAGMRKLETQILLDNKPNVPFKDVGGDPLLYIRLGMTDAHVCDPYEDPKDPTRHVMRQLVAKKIYSNPSWPQASRLMASRYLQRDPTFVCGKRAQDCNYKAKLSMSVHVYDIPLQDWPQIMHDSGILVHSGTVHFSPKFYTTTKGVLDASRAEYEIDAKEDTFKMGFKSSPSWWYEHSWMLYMRYGVDQIIEHETGRYSYKVMQRRGDTVFFQILKVDGNSRIETQCYRLPGVKMVKVQGFDLADRTSWDAVHGKYSQLQPKVYWFPESLWSDMLTQAENDFERNVMTFDKLLGYYRMVSPRNTVNGVLLSGDSTVDMQSVVPLVVHVGLVAAARVMLGKRESRVLTEIEVKRRVKVHRTAFGTLIDGFGQMAQAALGSGTGVVSWLCRQLFSLTDDLLMDSLVRWSVEAEVQEVPFDSIIGQASEANKKRWEAYQFQPMYDAFRTIGRAAVEGDHERALANAPHLKKMVVALSGDRPLSGSKAWTLNSETCVQSDPAPPEVDDSYKASTGDVMARRAAIMEAIEESELEERKINEHSHVVYQACMDSAGKPSAHVLTSRAEEYGQPDFWYVNGGVLQSESFLGNQMSSFEYSAVFHPRPDQYGNVFRTVREQEIENGETMVLEDFAFDGWVLVYDRLVIYNGPDIRATMKAAIDLPHDYKVVLKQGPPGCGKTYDLVQTIRPEDVAMCPVKESAVDTRTRIKEKYPGFPDIRNRAGTIDSFLANYHKPAKSKLRAERLLADEGFMTSSGRWYTAAALLGVKELRAFGDVHQIPHIPRVQASTVYLRLQAQITEYTWVTRRCPWDAVAAWGHIYDWKVRSTSSVKRSLSVATDWRGLAMPDGLVVLVMYQEGKKTARELLKPHLKTKKIQIMTVHESEGKTFQDVWMFRFDMRPRQDNMSLYDQRPHVLVGMSRHTKSFVYVRPRDLNDLVDVGIKQANDIRRVDRAGDMASAGTSMEF